MAHTILTCSPLRCSKTSIQALIREDKNKPVKTTTTFTWYCSRTLLTPDIWKPWVIDSWEIAKLFGRCIKRPPIQLFSYLAINHHPIPILLEELNPVSFTTQLSGEKITSQRSLHLSDHFSRWHLLCYPRFNVMHFVILWGPYKPHGGLVCPVSTMCCEARSTTFAFKMPVEAPSNDAVAWHHTVKRPGCQEGGVYLGD